MIQGLRLQNFRGFDDHTIPLCPMTVMVGQNNAGKTTIAEALRLVSIVVLRSISLGFNPPPDNLEIPRRMLGISPSLKNIEISFDTIFHQYQDPPAIITALFKGGASATIYILGDQKIFAVLKDGKGAIIKNRQEVLQNNFPAVRIMPQVAPLQRSEVILSEEYVKAAMSSRLAPLHFRNQLKIRFDLFPTFKKMVEDTWSGVIVKELIGRAGMPGKELHLQIRNESFVAEVAEMGHGLQMWLQTMWFLTLAQEAPTIILDEPDVYMHADLQRRIIRLLRNRYQQIIVMTHSVEIMSEVQPEEILVIDKRQQKSSFAGSLPAVQVAVDRWGSVHNLHLTRLLSAKKFVMVEGKDLKILKELHDLLFPDSVTPLQSVPNISLGGWSGWRLAIGSSMAFKNAFEDRIQIYCILDSDYHTEDEINARYKEAEQEAVELHIWKQKEIENYLLLPQVVARLVERRAAKRTATPTEDEVMEKLLSISDDLETDALDAIAQECLNKERKNGAKGANQKARKIMQKIREDNGNILSIISGKRALSLLSEWSSKEFGVSFSAMGLAKEIRQKEVPPEVAHILNSIEQTIAF